MSDLCVCVCVCANLCLGFGDVEFGAYGDLCTVLDFQGVRSPRTLQEESAAPNQDSGGPGEPGVSEQSSFQEEAAKRRVSVKDFCYSNPLPRLVLLRRVLTPFHILMGRFLVLSSSAWEQKQATLAASNKNRSYIILEACKGHDVQGCMSSLLALLHEPAVGFLSESVSCVFRLEKFCAVARGMGAVHVLLRKPRNGCPYSLFRLLLEDADALVIAEELLALPECLRGELGSYLLRVFPSPDALAGEVCRAMLAQIAVMQSVDVAEVESAHSSTREYASLRSKGWVSSLEVVSARFVLQQGRKFAERTHTRARRASEKAMMEAERKLESESPNSSVASSWRKAQVLAKPKPETPEKERRGGGGSWRAFLTCNARQFLGPEASKRMSIRYRSLSDEDMEFYKNVGQAGAVAHRAGYSAFGARDRAPVAAAGDDSGAIIPAQDAPRNNYGLVSVPFAGGGTFPERYAQLREKLRAEAEASADPLALSREEAYALLKLQRNTDALPPRQSWAEAGHEQLLHSTEAYPSSQPSVCAFTWRPPSKQMAEAGP